MSEATQGIKMSNNPVTQASVEAKRSTIESQVPQIDPVISTQLARTEVAKDLRIERLREDSREKNADIKILQKLVERDPLTRLLSRSALDERINEEAARTDRNINEGAATLLVLDGIGIGQINNDLGHLEGDTAIIQLAEAIKKSKRAPDAAGRWGGDEFVILLPETDLKGAKLIWERINAKLSKIKIGDTDLFLAVRGGAVNLDPKDPQESLKEGLKMMEDAKREAAGKSPRDKVIFKTPEGNL